MVGIRHVFREGFAKKGNFHSASFRLPLGFQPSPSSPSLLSGCFFRYFTGINRYRAAAMLRTMDGSVF